MKAIKADSLLLLAGATWGMGFVAQETAMDDVGPALFVGLRFVLAALVTLPFAIIQLKALPDSQVILRPRNLVFYTILGLVFFSGMFLQQVGLVYTNVSKAGFLTGLYIVFVPFVMRFFIGQEQHWLIWPSAMLALAGLYMLNYAPVDAFNLGDYLVLCCAFFWAAHVILVGKLTKEVNAPMVIACIQFSVTGVVGLLLYFMLAGKASFEPVANIARVVQAGPEILYAALAAGAFAFSLQIIAQRYTSEARAAILLSSEALFAALFAAIILSEALSPTGYFGCGLMFAAMLIIQVVPDRKTAQLNTG